MSEPAPKQTRPIAVFNDRLGVIPLRRLDYALGFAIVAFVLAALVDALLRYSSPDALTLLLHVHNHLGRFALAVSAVMFLLGLYIGLVRHADVTPYFRRGTYVCVGMMVLESLLGATMYFIIGARPYEEVHLIYGVGTVLSLPFFVFVETTAPKRPAMGSYMWGFGLLAGIIIRCLQTGIAG